MTFALEDTRGCVSALDEACAFRVCLNHDAAHEQDSDANPPREPETAIMPAPASHRLKPSGPRLRTPM